MNPSNTLKFFCLFFSLLITLAAVSAAPYSDYDSNVNELYDMLMQRENMDDSLGMHQVVRKSRGPQLRLRFGKRYEVSAYMAGVSSEADN